MSQDLSSSYLPLEDISQDSADQTKQRVNTPTHLSLSYDHFSMDSEIDMSESRSESGLFTMSELSAIEVDVPAMEGYERILLVERCDDPDLFEVKQRIKYLKQPHADENVFKAMLLADVVSFFLLALTTAAMANNPDHFNLVMLTTLTFAFILADSALIKLNMRADNYSRGKELVSLERRVAKKYIVNEYWKKSAGELVSGVANSSHQVNML